MRALLHFILFADDMDIFRLRSAIDLRPFILEFKRTIIDEAKLKFNDTKEEHYSFQNKSYVGVIKLGSILGDDANIKHRMQKATAVFWANINVLLHGRAKISVSGAMTVYTSIVLSVLLNNSGAWNLNKTQIKTLQTYHNRHLRSILLGSQYARDPDSDDHHHLPSVVLMSRTNSVPILYHLLRSRYGLLRRMLLLPETDPTMQWFMQYLTSNVLHRPTDAEILSNERPMSYPRSIQRQLLKIGIQFAVPADLLALRAMASNKGGWEAMLSALQRSTFATYDGGQFLELVVTYLER
jgi:hypothetical protein